MRVGKLFAIFIVLALSGFLYVSAQVSSTHNLIGMEREVANHTTGSYGMVLKYNPSTGLWTAQLDSLSAGVAADSLSLTFLRAIGDTLYFRTKASVWMMKLTGTNVNFANDIVVAGVAAWVDSANVTEDGIGNGDLAVNSVSTTEIRDATIDSVDVKDGSLAIADVNNGANGFALKPAMTDSLLLRMLKAAYPDSANNPRSDIDIDGGAIDGTPIGANAKSTAAFTTVTADTSFTLSHGTPWDMTDGQYQGQTVIGKADTTIVFGQVCYMKSDGDYCPADADGVGTMPGLVMALESMSAGDYKLFLQTGYVCEADWTTVQTKGALVYVSTTTGTPDTTAPTGAADQVQVLGYCIGTDIMYFRPDWTLVEVPTP